MKPLGVSFGVFGDGGGPIMRVTEPDRISDSIWQAVQDAICANWTPERFKREVAEAWEHELKEAAKDAVCVLSK